MTTILSSCCSGRQTDIQFVAESSLALANYVTGYVTKPEKSSMQEVWQEVSDAKSVYSHLWKFGVRALRSRESGLYEACDIVLGDHLCEKSDTVQWVDVSMPHKRNRRLKHHKELVEMEATDPDSEDIYSESLRTHYYPGRPDELDTFVFTTLLPTTTIMAKMQAGIETIKS